MQIYHNPRCRKSRETLAIIQEKGVEPEIVEYLKTPIDEATLKDILDKLGMAPMDITRKEEKLFKEDFKGKELSDAEWIKILVDNPVLIQRPIVIKDNKAILGRPPENVLSLLS